MLTCLIVFQIKENKMSDDDKTSMMMDRYMEMSVFRDGSGPQEEFHRVYGEVDHVMETKAWRSLDSYRRPLTAAEAAAAALDAAEAAEAEAEDSDLDAGDENRPPIPSLEWCKARQDTWHVSHPSCWQSGYRVEQELACYKTQQAGTTPPPPALPPSTDQRVYWLPDEVWPIVWRHLDTASMWRALCVSPHWFYQLKRCIKTGRISGDLTRLTLSSTADVMTLWGRHLNVCVERDPRVTTSWRPHPAQLFDTVQHLTVRCHQDCGDLLPPTWLRSLCLSARERRRQEQGLAGALRDLADSWALGNQVSTLEMSCLCSHLDVRKELGLQGTNWGDTTPSYQHCALLHASTWISQSMRRGVKELKLAVKICPTTFRFAVSSTSNYLVEVPRSAVTVRQVENVVLYLPQLREIEFRETGLAHYANPVFGRLANHLRPLILQTAVGIQTLIQLEKLTLWVGGHTRRYHHHQDSMPATDAVALQQEVLMPVFFLLQRLSEEHNFMESLEVSLVQARRLSVELILPGPRPWTEFLLEGNVNALNTDLEPPCSQVWHTLMDIDTRPGTPLVPPPVDSDEDDNTEAVEQVISQVQDAVRHAGRAQVRCRREMQGCLSLVPGDKIGFEPMKIWRRNKQELARMTDAVGDLLMRCGGSQDRIRLMMCHQLLQMTRRALHKQETSTRVSLMTREVRRRQEEEAQIVQALVTKAVQDCHKAHGGIKAGQMYVKHDADTGDKVYRQTRACQQIAVMHRQVKTVLEQAKARVPDWAYDLRQEIKKGLDLCQSLETRLLFSEEIAQKLNRQLTGSPAQEEVQQPEQPVNDADDEEDNVSTASSDSSELSIMSLDEYHAYIARKRILDRLLMVAHRQLQDQNNIYICPTWLALLPYPQQDMNHIVSVTEAKAYIRDNWKRCNNCPSCLANLCAFPPRAPILLTDFQQDQLNGHYHHLSHHPHYALRCYEHKKKSVPLDNNCETRNSPFLCSCCV